MLQVGIGKGEGGHGLDNGDGTREDARVVAAVSREEGGAAVDIDRRLFAQEGGNGLEGHAEDDVVAVADAALDAAAVVGGGGEARQESIVLLRTAKGRTRKTEAVLKTFDGVDGEHGVGKGGVEFVESGRAPARRAAGDEAFDDAAHGVAFAFDLEDELRHALGRRGVGTTHVVAVDLVEGEVAVVFVEHNGTYLPRPGGDAHPELSQEDLCKRPAHHTAHGFAGRTTPAAAMVANAVFALVGEIGVGGSEDVAQVVVVRGVVLGVAHEKSDGGAGGAAFKDAGEEFDLIGFAAWGGEAALSRPAAVELVLNEIGVDVEAGGHAVDDAAYADAVAFAKGGEAEELSEGVHDAEDERGEGDVQKWRWERPTAMCWSIGRKISVGDDDRGRSRNLHSHRDDRLHGRDGNRSGRGRPRRGRGRNRSRNLRPRAY